MQSCDRVGEATEVEQVVKQGSVQSWFFFYTTKVNSDLSSTCKMELFVKIFNRYKPLTTVTKKYILNY